MIRVFIILLDFVLVSDCEIYAAAITAKDLQHQFQIGKPIIVGIIGNSKACGYRQTGWGYLQEGGTNIDSRGLLTQAGEDNPHIQGWAQNLQRWLISKNNDSVIYNYAGSGWSTKTHLDRGTVEALAYKNPKPQAVFIQLNVNDRLKDTVTISRQSGGISWEEYLANTREIIRRLRQQNILPILVKEDNVPLAAGKGWRWSEYDTGMGGGSTGTHDGTHRPFSDYVAAYDVIAHDKEWGTPLTVLDAYTPTLNTGQEPRFIHDGSPAPVDFRHGLMRGSLGNLDDVWHQNDKGGAIILRVYQAFFLSNQAD